MKINRIILIILDSVGIGEAPDAVDFGDVGSNTLGNIARVMGGLNLPNLEKMGLANINLIQGLQPQAHPTAAYGKLQEVSGGKDSTTGHWELMGLPLPKPFPLYPQGFPPEIMRPFEAEIGRGTLGNYPASGTAIIEELGAEHVRTGKVIVYTSGDSVFQIAAHEDIVPIAELYDICRVARKLLTSEHEVSRVIARPFVGQASNFTRTANRHDFSVPPPASTLLDYLQTARFMVHAIGKIEDLFAGQGITQAIHTKDNADGLAQTLNAMHKQSEPGLIFTNLVDFDSEFGHRNNPQGYAQALEAFDAYLPKLLNALKPDDILMITADHGNDPTTPSTDHAREYVPLLISGASIKPLNIGIRASFADVAATIAQIWSLETGLPGQSFASQICSL